MGSVAAHSGSVIRARSTSGRRVLLIGALALGGVVLALFFLAVVERVVYAGDVMPGVDVGGLDVASRSEDAAYARLQTAATTLESQPLRAKLGDKDVAADPSVLGVEVDAAATLGAARRAGRSGNPVEQTLGAVLRRIRTDKVALHVTYSEPGLDGVLDGWQREAASGGVEGNLQFNGTQVVEVAPQRGMGIDRADAERRLVGALHTPGDDPVVLRVGRLEPQISQAEVARAAARARELLTGTHELSAATTTLAIAPEQLASALGTRADGHRLDLTLDADKLRATLGAGLAAFEVQPANATFQITSSNTVEVVPSVDGRQVDLHKVTAEILDGDRRVAAPVIESHPAHDTAWAQSLHINEQVSTFTTHHNSGEDRVVNIHRAADLLNNTVVEPGATFSLNDTIGPRTAERGFVVAPVFYGGESEDVGGGVSQVATTTFNAVFFGGYEDVYHKPHSIYISRYPMGREATVNYPTVDLKFRNDSKAGVLIRTSYSSTSITVTFYGDKEGKVVTEDGRKKLAEYPIVPQYFDCPGPAGLDKTNACAKLGAGETKLAESGHTGIDVEYFRVITRPGAEPVRHRFFWRYKMFPNKYLVGKGAPPTTAAPGATTVPTTPSTPSTPAAPTPTAAPPAG